MTATPEPVGGRLLTPAFVLLGLADLAYFACAGVVVLTLPLYVTGPVGSDEAGAGLAVGSFGITALVCRPFVGRWSDRVGRRPLMLGGALLCAVGVGLTAVAESLAVVVALRLLLGVAEAAFFVAGFALVADLAPPERMGEALSLNSLGLYLGLALGPLLGEALLGWGGYDAAWSGAALLAVLAGGLVLVLREPPRDGRDEGHGRLIHRPAIPLSLGLLTSLLAVSAFLTFAALHAESVGLESAGLALFVYGVVVVVCRVLFASLPDRVPPLPLAATALAGQAVGLVLLAAWQAPAGLLVGAAVLGVSVAFVAPAFFAALFAKARPSERGAASGTASAVIDVGLGLGPVLLGLVARDGGIPAAFVVAAAVALLGAAWTLLLARRAAAPLSRSGPR
jgi:predicted MFS family arabinose efflux permease